MKRGESAAQIAPLSLFHCRPTPGFQPGRRKGSYQPSSPVSDDAPSLESCAANVRSIPSASRSARDCGTNPGTCTQPWLRIAALTPAASMRSAGMTGMPCLTGTPSDGVAGPARALSPLSSRTASFRARTSRRSTSTSRRSRFRCISSSISLSRLPRGSPPASASVASRVRDVPRRSPPRGRKNLIGERFENRATQAGR